MDNFNLKIIKIIKTYILNDTNLNKICRFNIMRSIILKRANKIML